jgi:Rieske Fe-S protein
MAGEDQERFEDYLALERYIEALRAGHTVCAPADLTPELARIFRIALLFHAASRGEADPRPAFIAELEGRLKEEQARRRTPLKGHHSSASSHERQAHSPVPRRALLIRGAAVAASLSIGAGIDHVLEGQHSAASTTAPPTPASWLPLVPDDIPTTRHFVTTLDRLGEQPVPFRAGGIAGYLVRNDAEYGDSKEGPVIALSAACTHMGCLVNWERSDRTFRCPCHGGVFSAAGLAVATPSVIRYLAPLPHLQTIIDPAGNVFVRVPAQPSSIP